MSVWISSSAPAVFFHRSVLIGTFSQYRHSLNFQTTSWHTFGTHAIQYSFKSFPTQPGSTNIPGTISNSDFFMQPPHFSEWGNLVARMWSVPWSSSQSLGTFSGTFNSLVWWSHTDSAVDGLLCRDRRVETFLCTSFLRSSRQGWGWLLRQRKKKSHG